MQRMYTRCHSAWDLSLPAQFNQVPQYPGTRGSYLALNVAPNYIARHKWREKLFGLNRYCIATPVKGLCILYCKGTVYCIYYHVQILILLIKWVCYMILSSMHCQAICLYRLVCRRIGRGRYLVYSTTILSRTVVK
jgi:hypothetical protein